MNSIRARPPVFVAALAIAVLTLGACTATAPNPSSTPASSTPATLTPDQAADIIRATVTGADPLLFINAMPSYWRAEVRADASTFTATYRGMAKTVTLTIAVANLPLPDANTVQTHPNFHGDASSIYQVADGREPLSDRWLMWTETGTWSQPGPGGVPYLLSASGLTDAAFWLFANSLHPNQI